MNTAGDLLHRISAWLLLLALAAAPWLLGTVPPWSITLLLCVLGAAGVSWGAGLLFRGGDHWPPVNAATVLAGVLLLQGFWMTVNPVSAYNATTQHFEKIRDPGFTTGSVDGFSSRQAMLSFAVLFVAFHVAVDHARTPEGEGGRGVSSAEAFRRAVAWVVAGTGASVAVLGIAQHAGLPQLLKPFERFNEGQAFGPFNYHANAGAFLLLTLPLAAVLAARSLASGKFRTGLTATIFAAVILAGIFTNTARGAAVLAILLTVALGAGIWRTLSPVLPSAHARRTWLLLGIGIVTALAVGIVLSATLMPEKWALLSQQVGRNSPRGILFRIDAGMAADAGFLGFGPNTFAVEFPTSPRMNPDLYRVWIVTPHTPGARMSIWSHAHNDALQAYIEWGWLGGTLWLLLAALTLVAGWRACRRSTGGPANARLLLLGAFIALLAVLTYSLFDFPLQVLVLQLYAITFAALLWAERGLWIARPAVHGAGSSALEPMPK